MREMTQAGGGPAQAPAPSAAEMARIDAQLELAAKKAALAGMERAAAQGGDVGALPAPPPAPGERVITITQGDKTITLTNPTPEQLAEIGVSRGADVPVTGWQLVALTGAVVGGAIAIIAMILAYRRSTRGIAADPKASESAARMARIENAVESIAVEVERISEGQRYTSRLLSEGGAEPAKVNVNVPEVLGAVLQNREAR